MIWSSLKYCAVAVLGLGATTMASATTVASYEFSGTTYNAYGGIADGQAVTGTFNINLDAVGGGFGSPANPSEAGFQMRSQPSELIFSMNLQVDGVDYSASTLGAYSTFDAETGRNGQWFSEWTYYPDAQPQHATDAFLGFVEKSLGQTSGTYAYLSNGLLNLDAVDLSRSMGYYTNYSSAGFFFTVSSLSATSSIPPGGAPVIGPLLVPTPLPAAAWLLVSGFAGLSVLRLFMNGRFQTGGMSC